VASDQCPATATVECIHAIDGLRRGGVRHRPTPTTTSSLVATIVACCVGAGGCRPDATATSRGTVVFDGQPIETGLIVLRPVDGRLGPEAAPIEAGRFVVTGRPGRRRVEIRGTQVVPEAKLSPSTPRMPGVPYRRDYVPAAYNTESTIEVEVKAGSANVFDFDLKTP
jgi:hypothetical protein